MGYLDNAGRVARQLSRNGTWTGCLDNAGRVARELSRSATWMVSGSNPNRLDGQVLKENVDDRKREYRKCFLCACGMRQRAEANLILNVVQRDRRWLSHIHTASVSLHCWILHGENLARPYVISCSKGNYQTRKRICSSSGVNRRGSRSRIRIRLVVNIHPMKGSLRQHSPGAWEFTVGIGRNPLVGRQRWASGAYDPQHILESNLRIAGN